MKPFSIAIHGGAGEVLAKNLNPDQQKEYHDALSKAVDMGYAVLEKGGTALDAVEAAVVDLENCPLFNAARGAVFNSDGKHELDAAIMDGKTLGAGAICGVSSVKNPVKLARKVMTDSQHVFLAGAGAAKFAKANGIEFEKDEYFFTQLRFDQLQEARATGQVALDHVKKFGTVGAVALDVHGNLAAATSTGGMTNKMPGRVGDAPLIGAGTYANNKTCAVSATGHGEYMIRAVIGHLISSMMEFGGMPLDAAADRAVNQVLKQLGGEGGGVIAVDQQGNVAMPFNTEGMFRACRTSAGRVEIKMFGDY